MVLTGINAQGLYALTCMSSTSKCKYPHTFLCVYDCVYVCACMHACVCACVSEREREREKKIYLYF